MGIVIVTGGLGFIGSHTVKSLCEDGYEVHVLDKSPYDGIDDIQFMDKSVKFWRIDVSSWRAVNSFFKENLDARDVEGLIHLAAMVSIVEVARRPGRALRVNVSGTLNLLEVARRFDIERFVFASSAAVYGEPKNIPIDEDHPLEPTNLYGETKVMGEMLLWRYMKDHSIKPVALRYFNVYGPRMKPGRYAGVVYKFIESLLKGSRPVIYGDGSQTRDFVFVKDVARANKSALETNYTGPINIGSGREISILSLYETLCSLVKRCPPPIYKPSRPGDVKRSVAHIDKASEILAWKPKVSIYDGLRQTLEYYGIKATKDDK